MIKRFLCGSIVFLLLSVSVSALEFPAHFVIPPIVEVPDLEYAGLYFPSGDRVEVRNLINEAVLVHEIGHSVMWDVQFPVCDSFVSRYARTSVDEDKAESFMIFYFSREHFRRMARVDKCLMLKYKAVYRVFYPRNITK